ncbi:hypothetical protein SAMN05421505_10685 [Sinosporangium album]|uniref:Uncharacterized protein n=1 Tax=Sinosporangium album TaxID=504805 RepID=A0A1G7VW37_9ACTN|nr:Rv3235 family protein [Sinosporangium album]SDG64025.1 hypothetical protein SAMN05421505_10685 [Sinosporangium album]
MPQRPRRNVHVPAVASARPAEPPFAGPSDAPQWLPEELDGKILEWRGCPPSLGRLRELGQAVADVLAGRCPDHVVASRMNGRGYGDLLAAAGSLGALPAPRAGEPRVQHPTPEAIEMCFTVWCGERAHALAMRLERHGTLWLCTRLEFR